MRMTHAGGLPEPAPDGGTHAAQPSTVTAIGYNGIFVVTFRGGWKALTGGMTQARAVRDATEQINRDGRRVVACVPDKWGFVKSVKMFLLAVISFGFKVYKKNVIFVTEQIR
jgi:hypothetical protein